MLKKPWPPSLALLFCGMQFMSVALGIVVVSVLHKVDVAGFRHDEDFGNILIATLSFQGMTWVLIPVFLRMDSARIRDAFGLNLWNFFRASGWAVVVLIAALAFEYIYEFMLQKTGWRPPSQTAVKLLNDAPLWPTGIYLAFFAVALAPVAEEFIFRGVLFPLVKHLGFPKFAWIGVSLLFALIHGDMAIFIPLFVLALMLTWLYEKTENLLAPVMAHSLFNAVNLVGLIYQNR
jgi:membrane protease YdiL (CAAX protease family)